jgi:uncharacterized coiled-coil protein SlyX
MRSSDFLKLNLPELIDKANILKVSESLEWIDDAVKQLNLIHASINQRLTALELKVDAQDNTIDDLRTNIHSVVNLCNSLGSRLNTVESTVTAQGNSIATLRAEIQSLTATCTSINARLTAAETGLQTTNSNLNALQANYLHDIAEITRNVAATDGKVDALAARHSQDISQIQLQLANVTANLQTFTDTMESLDARVTALEEGEQPQPVPKFWIYYGGSDAETPSVEAINSLPYKLYTDTVYRTVSITCLNQYCYYCIPADQPNVQFEVSNFTGGFENPITIPIAIEGEETTDYKVYRSCQRLNGTATYKIKP